MLNFFVKYKRIKELKFICKRVIIKSLVEFTNINENLQNDLYSKIDISVIDNIYTCQLENFSIYFKNGIFEMSIPYILLYDYIEKNISLNYKIIDVKTHKYNKWIIVQFI